MDVKSYGLQLNQLTFNNDVGDQAGSCQPIDADAIADRQASAGAVGTALNSRSLPCSVLTWAMSM